MPQSREATKPIPLQAVLDALPPAVFVIDAAGTIIHANRAFEDLWGDVGGQWRSAWGENPLVARTPPRPAEIRVELPSGERITLMQHVHPLWDERGRVTGAVVVHVDVTEQRRHEQAEQFLTEATRILSLSFDYNETLREVARRAVSGFASWCAVYLRVEDSLQSLGSAARDETERRRFEEIERLYPPPPARATEEVARRGAPLLIPTVTEGFLRKEAVDGRHLEMLRALGLKSVLIVPLVAHGEKLGALSLLAGGSARAFDADDLQIAERVADRAAVALENARIYQEAKRSAVQEKALRRAAGAVSAASTIPEVIREIADQALEALSADGAFVERLDVHSQEVELVAASGIWTPETGLRLPYQGSLAQTVIERGTRVLLEGGEHQDSVLLRQLSDACGPCAILVVPLRDSGEPIGCLILIRASGGASFEADEGARAEVFGELAALAFRKIHLLEETERRRVDLERVTESRTRLIRGFAHDLKNPINAADGYLALLSEQFSEGLDERQAGYLSRTRGLLRAATSLIEELGELHRAEAGRIPVRPLAVEMVDLVRELVEAYRPQAELKGLTLLFEHPDEVPVIESDASRVRQILGNLLSNAVKYTEEGEIRARVAVHQRGSGAGSWVAVEVADTGPGIPVDKQDLVFQEFTRVSPETSRGTGLGLAISQRIAEALRGRITVRSEVGMGSVFTLWLPRIPRLDGPVDEPPIMIDTWPSRVRPAGS